jgi:hypothetical protein
MMKERTRERLVGAGAGFIVAITLLAIVSIIGEAIVKACL